MRTGRFRWGPGFNPGVWAEAPPHWTIGERRGPGRAGGNQERRKIAAPSVPDAKTAVSYSVSFYAQRSNKRWSQIEIEEVRYEKQKKCFSDDFNCLSIFLRPGELCAWPRTCKKWK